MAIATQQRSLDRSRGAGGAGVALFGASLGLGSFWLWTLGDGAYDDAYIYFRYAENLLAGNGAVFNPGEHVEGYSSFSWLLLVALGALLHVPLDLWSQLLGALCFLVSGLLLYRYGRERFGDSIVAALPALVFLAAPANAFAATLGLETALLAMLLLLALRSDSGCSGSPRRQLGLAALFLAISLTRPEGVAYYLGYLVFDGARQLRNRGRLDLACSVRLAAGLVPFAAAVLTRVAYYGHPLPNPYYAKVGYSTATLWNGLLYLLDYVEAHVGGGLLLAAAVAYGILVERDRSWSLALALLGCGAVLVALSGGNNLPGWRYAAPLGGLVAIVVGDFLAHCFLAARRGGRRQRAFGLLASLLLANVLLSGSAALIGRDELRRVVANNQHFAASARFHGLLFSEILSPGQSIALNAVPILAYHFPGRVIDMLGLVDETIAHRQVEMGRRIHGHEKGDGQHVLAQRPTVIILAGGPFLESDPIAGYPGRRELYYLSETEIASSLEFRNRYEPIAYRIAGRYSNFYLRRDERLRPIAPERLAELVRNMRERARPTRRAALRDALHRGWLALRETAPLRWYLALRRLANPSGRPLA